MIMRMMVDCHGYQKDHEYDTTPGVVETYVERGWAVKVERDRLAAHAPPADATARMIDKAKRRDKR